MERAEFIAHIETMGFAKKTEKVWARSGFHADRFNITGKLRVYYEVKNGRSWIRKRRGWISNLSVGDNGRINGFAPV